MAKVESSYAIRTEIIKDATEEDYRQLEAGTYQTVTSDTITTLTVTYPDDIVIINPRIESPIYEVLKGGTIVIVEVTEFIINTEPEDAEDIIKTIGSDYVARLVHGDVGARPSYRILDEDVNTVFEDLKQEPSPNVCPICYSKLDPPTWEDDPTKTKNGIAGRKYIGTQNIKTPHIKDIQDIRKEQEQDVLPTESLTEFSPANDTGQFQITKSHITELRESTEKILAIEGLTKEEYFNYDEDGLNRGTNQVDWHDPNLGDYKGHVKALHIEDLRHHIDFSQLYSVESDKLNKWQYISNYTVINTLELGDSGGKFRSVVSNNKNIYILHGGFYGEGYMEIYNKRFELQNKKFFEEIFSGGKLGTRIIIRIRGFMNIIRDKIYIVGGLQNDGSGNNAFIAELNLSLELIKFKAIKGNGLELPSRFVVDDNYLYVLIEEHTFDKGFIKEEYVYSVRVPKDMLNENHPFSEPDPTWEPSFEGEREPYLSHVYSSNSENLEEVWGEKLDEEFPENIDRQNWWVKYRFARIEDRVLRQYGIRRFKLSDFSFMDETYLRKDDTDFYTEGHSSSITVDNDNIYIIRPIRDYIDYIIDEALFYEEGMFDRKEYDKWVTMEVYNKNTFSPTHYFDKLYTFPTFTYNRIVINSVTIFKENVLVSFESPVTENPFTFYMNKSISNGVTQFSSPIKINNSSDSWFFRWGDSVNRIST